MKASAISAGTAQAPSGQEDGAVGEIRAGDAHQRGCDRVTAGRITEIAAGTNRHGAAPDQTETDAGDSRGDDAAGQALQQRRDEDHDERRREREDQRGHAGRDDAAREQAALPGDGVDECSARDLPDESGDPADGQDQPDVAVRPAEMGKIKGDESAKARLDIGNEEIRPVEAIAALPGCRRV